MATAPPLVLLFDRTFVGGSFAVAWSRRRGYYLALAGTWVLLAWFVVQGSGVRGTAAGFGLGISWWAYLLKQCEALVLYLKLSVWPHPLVLDYGNAVANSVARVWWQGTFVLGLLAGTAWALWRKPALGFAGAWFFIILAPSSSIVPLVAQTMAEHRMYLPLAGIVSLTAVALHRRLGARSGWILAVVAIVFAGLTVARNHDYRDGVTIWSDSVASFPASARAHNNLGKELLLVGRAPEAITHLKDALRLKPDYAKAHNNLGVALVEHGQIAEAIGHYETALQLSSNDGEAHHNLGNALLRIGRIAEAEVHYALALQRKPEFAAAQANNLGRVRLEAGRVTEAITLFTEALRLQPEFAEAHNNLGNALVEAGRAGGAMAHYQAALRLQPDDAEARFNLGNALLATGRLEEACESYRAALALRPGLVEAHNNLGSALFRLGRLDEAAAQYREALRLWPDYAEAKANLARLHPPGR
jgi:tetratricopeptide (TPR) repeat protein